MKSILITGCSSGFGLETARYFLAKGWHVIATMRTPCEDILPPSEHLQMLALDVTDLDSVRHAVAAAGPLDVLVNNAGFGAGSPIELTPMATARQLFDTNTLGALAMIQAVAPQFRKRRAGVIINVSSSVTYKRLPVIGVYRASKAALNALTESLAVELEPLGVRVRLVLPGRSPQTRFADNAKLEAHALDHEAYAELVRQVLAQIQDTTTPITYARDVAAAVWQAATDPACPLYLPAGADAVAWAEQSDAPRQVPVAV